MKTSIFFFLLAMSASAVLSNPVTNAEVATNKVLQLYSETVSKLLNAIGTESEDVNEAKTEAGTAFNKMVDSALNGKYDTDARDEVASAFSKTVSGLAALTGYSGDDLTPAIQVKIEGLYEALDAVFNKPKSYVYVGVHKDMTGYRDAFEILSKYAGDVDISEELKEITEQYYNSFTGMYDANRQTNNLSAQEAAKVVGDSFDEKITKFMNALGVEDEDIKESVRYTNEGLQESIDSAYNGIYNEEAGDKSIKGWEGTIFGLFKYVNVDQDEISKSVEAAGVGLYEALNNAINGTRDDLITAVDKAVTEYINVLRTISDSIGSLDISELLSNAREAYYDAFNSVYDNNHVATTDDASS